MFYKASFNGNVLELQGHALIRLAADTVLINGYSVMFKTWSVYTKPNFYFVFRKTGNKVNLIEQYIPSKLVAVTSKGLTIKENYIILDDGRRQYFDSIQYEVALRGTYTPEDTFGGYTEEEVIIEREVTDSWVSLNVYPYKITKQWGGSIEEIGLPKTASKQSRTSSEELSEEFSKENFRDYLLKNRKCK